MMALENTVSDVKHQSDVVASLVFRTGTRLREIERTVILETLKQQGFNRTHAAKVLGIGIRTLQRKLKKYGAANVGLSNVISA